MTGNTDDIGRGWAPQPIFEKLLAYYVVPTFDLILEFPDGIFMARRRYSPYEGKWALPGLRMLKGESIESCLERIAYQEAGVTVSGAAGWLLSQASARFSTDNQRQDLASCYVLTVLGGQEPAANPDHFFGWRFVRAYDELPPGTGSLYEGFLKEYFGRARPH